jgi:DeoR family suf operon transcriptional repressor
VTTASTPALAALPPTRQALLRLLQRAGEADAAELAEALAVTPSAVRQHLTALRADGLVVHREVADGPGRPRHVYALGPAAATLFPAAYDELALELLDGMADEDPELLARCFARRRRRRVERARARLVGRDLADQVVELARILDEDGYVATSEEQPDGSWRIVEHHCAIFSVARRYGHACSSELDFLRAVLPTARVQRVAHMVAGEHHCAYEITPRGGA